jgi:hypothetical protein
MISRSSSPLHELIQVEIENSMNARDVIQKLVNNLLDAKTEMEM